MAKKKVKKKKTTKAIIPAPGSDISLLNDVFNGDAELALFFKTYLENDRNASKAYKILHRDCTDHSCRVLGSRKLAKVSIQVIMDSYGLGIDKYLKKLNEGLEANDSEEKIYSVGKGKKKKFITKTITRPNHAVQKSYHDKLGEILKVEKLKDTTTVAVQVNNLINDKKNKYGI
jgi:hypothetical protein